MARYSESDLDRIYERTDGRCHLCYAPLDRGKYGSEWEIDHSKARASGGSDHINNLFPACRSCNRSKKAQSSRSARNKRNLTRPPLSKPQKAGIKKGKAIAGGILGMVAAAGFGTGFVGALLLGGIGAGIGWGSDPDEGKWEDSRES